MTLVFGFTTPEAVLMVAASELDAFDTYRTTRTYLLSSGFAALSRLRPFCRSREEQLCEPLASTVTHPVVIGCNAVEFDGRHVHTPVW